VRVVELGAHQRAQHAASPVRRVDTDDTDPGRRQVSTRNGQVERERCGPTDDRAVRPRAVHPLERDLIHEALHSLVRRRGAEILADREECGRELLDVANGADLEAHQNSSGQ
jgi:hypothetical protein